MESTQKCKLSMGMTTRDYLLPHQTITTPLPGFTTNFTTLQSTLEEIQIIAKFQDFEKTGITDYKLQLKNTLCILSADHSRKLFAYASFTNNAVLIKEIKISESELRKIADVDLITKAQELYDRAQSNLTDLELYGITEATQTSLLSTITAFNASIPKPRLGIDEKKQATQQLLVLFKTLDIALNNLDIAINIVRLTQPNFYNGYKTARKIILKGTTSISVKGLVTDANSGMPVKGATVMILAKEGAMKNEKLEESASSPTVLIKKTAEKGGIHIKSLPSGTYDVTVKKVGYSDAVTTLYVNDNEMSLLKVEISKN